MAPVDDGEEMVEREACESRGAENAAPRYLPFLMLSALHNIVESNKPYKLKDDKQKD